ncbi:MAG: hypothetical protein AB1768_16920 [Pseudomonadota bacterium]|jgi:hypothetical protein
MVRKTNLAVADAAPEADPAPTPADSEGEHNPSEVQGTDATGAIAEALTEAERASQQAEEALQAEGVTVKPLKAGRPPRTREQLVRAAKRQRDYGRKLLQRRTGGFASIMRDVKLNNAVLAAAFERFFPIIEQCAYLVARHGAATLGEAAAEQILERLNAMAAEALADRKKELAAAQALSGETAVTMGDAFVTPHFTQPAYTGSVQIRTPYARSVLDLFVISDAILTEAETLYWNQVRSLSEKNDEALRAKRVVFPLFQFAASTIRHLHRKMRERNGEVESAVEAATGEAPVKAEAIAG